MVLDWIVMNDIGLDCGGSSMFMMECIVIICPSVSESVSKENEKELWMSSVALSSGLGRPGPRLHRK
jgi:hypothetical protein